MNQKKLFKIQYPGAAVVADGVASVASVAGVVKFVALTVSMEDTAANIKDMERNRHEHAFFQIVPVYNCNIDKGLCEGKWVPWGKRGVAITCIIKSL